MSKDNPRLGSTFESWLDARDLREEATAAAVNDVLAEAVAAAMEERGLTRARMAALIGVRRAQLNRLLDPAGGGATLETLLRAAKAVGRELRVELV